MTWLDREGFYQRHETGAWICNYYRDKPADIYKFYAFGPPGSATRAPFTDKGDRCEFLGSHGSAQEARTAVETFLGAANAGD